MVAVLGGWSCVSQQTRKWCMRINYKWNGMWKWGFFGFNVIGWVFWTRKEAKWSGGLVSECVCTGVSVLCVGGGYALNLNLLKLRICWENFISVLVLPFCPGSRSCSVLTFFVPLIHSLSSALLLPYPSTHPSILITILPPPSTKPTLSHLHIPPCPARRGTTIPQGRCPCSVPPGKTA